MPQVASDPKIYAHSQTLPRVARPPQQSDRAPSPFESLLDDSAQGAEQPTPPPPDHKTSPVDNSQAPAKSNDSKAPADDNTVTTTKAGEAGANGKPDQNEKPAGDHKTDAKAKATAATGDRIKTADDNDKPTDRSKTDAPAVMPSTGNIQTLTTPDAVVVAPTSAPIPDQTPAPNAIDQTIQPADAAAILAAGASNSAALKGGTGKLADGAKKVGDNTQAGADKSTNDATIESPLTAKVAPQQHADKPQSGPSENDKEQVAEARGEAPTNSHRGETDAPTSAPADANVAAPKLSADVTQPAIVNTTQTTAPATSNPVFAVPAAPLAAAVPLAGLAIDIAGKAFAGKNRFEIRLDPPELGRIEVRLDVDRDGNVTSRLTVDRADTLDLLRRDASGLERALQDAGLKTADNGLQFSLRDQSMSQQQTNTGADTAQIVVKDEALPSIDVIPQNYGRLAGQGNGLDIRV
ncbi:MAG TPA: flagellar hook-length control protein FliK [Pseudolabrys sp.]|nr:flagellar hook-length control protein FliK [Pseudolabrys sp.]